MMHLRNIAQLSNLSQKRTLILRHRSYAKKNATVIDLISAAAKNDIGEVSRIVEEEKVDVNGCDYDHRFPLHLAAAEGHLVSVKYLVSQGANIHAIDRWGNTPLSEAITAEHGDVVKFLRESGGVVGKLQHGVSPLCMAAANGDLEQVKQLVENGHSVNAADYESRTPLHLASTKGHFAIVEYLVKNKADVNAIDKNGFTPLHDAQTGASMDKRKIVRLLKDHGAEISADHYGERNDPDFLQHVLNCMDLAESDSGLEFQYGEIWIPGDKSKFLFPSDVFFSSTKDAFKTNSEFHYTQTEGRRLSKNEELMGAAWETKEPATGPIEKVVNDPQRREALLKAGYTDNLVVPIVHQNKVMMVLSLYAKDVIADENMRDVSSYFNGLINSPFKKNSDSLFESFPKSDRAKMQGIFEYIVNQGIFNSKIAYQDVCWFYKLGISQVYFQKYSIDEIGRHLHALAAAKKLAQTSGDPNNIWLQMNTEEQLFIVCPATFQASLKIERKLERKISEVSSDRSISVTYLCSTNPVTKDGNRLNFYILEHDRYVNPDSTESDTSLWKISTPLFLADKSSIIRDRYQELINEAVGKVAPSIRIHEVYQDGTIPVTLTVRSGRVKPQLVKFTELCRSLKLTIRRKFIETFANDMTIYSYYIEGERESVDNLVNEMSMIVSVPHTELIELFIEDKLSCKSYVYATSVARCIYYFLQKRDESVLTLEEALKGNAENISRFRLLRQKLSGEAASMGRIYDVVKQYPNVVDLLFRDFEERLLNKNPAGLPEAREAINTLVSNVFDRHILTEFLTFNSNVVKTNFYKDKKAAISFRLDPKFVTQSDFPENPFGIFWVIGTYFQGFHIRFRDVARGGIRLIMSRNKPAYEHNLATVFQENYGLAHTQNRKNKDIPEFGSKGTVLLHASAQSLRKISFQSYISSLMDLIVLNDKDIVDLYNKEELLFLGPDENTADLMEWAALYAKQRGYPYWKAFTTGKPPSLGGVPHDAYGMTTRSVHQYVLGCLEKLGLKESEITKFQTGGPDGDLGSNEITISYDKTTSIVDGAGVIYDPKGLNREELNRLAHARLTSEDFDESLLSEGGFKVRVTDENVTLPSGEVIKTGLQFRNDFHMNPLSTADLFVPCGGRPGSVDLNNVKGFFDKNGKPRFKIIVEGANLFITQDARLILEKSGVILYKDASANKGGVTSSSLEVLAALALSEKDHDELMCVHDDNVPEFYKEYVQDIIAAIEHNARMEFEAIWNEHERLGTSRSILTDLLSDKINELCSLISHSELYRKDDLRRKVLSKAIPPSLLNHVGMDQLEQNVPDSYLMSIFSTYLASHFVYKYGLNSNEFSFFEFLNEMQEE